MKDNKQSDSFECSEDLVDSDSFEQRENDFDNIEPPTTERGLLPTQTNADDNDFDASPVTKYDAEKKEKQAEGLRKSVRFATVGTQGDASPVDKKIVTDSLTKQTT